MSINGSVWNAVKGKWSKHELGHTIPNTKTTAFYSMETNFSAECKQCVANRIRFKFRLHILNPGNRPHLLPVTSGMGSLLLYAPPYLHINEYAITNPIFSKFSSRHLRGDFPHVYFANVYLKF